MVYRLEKNVILQNTFLLILFFASATFYTWKYNVNMIVAIGFFLYGLWEKPSKLSRGWAISLFSVFYLYAAFNQYGNVNLFGEIMTLLPLTLFFISDDNWARIYEKYVFVYCLALIPSLLLYFIVIWGDVNLPFKVISPLNETKDYNYIAYPFLVVVDNLQRMRFCGYFDEPGVIGTFSGVFLLTSKMNLKDWKLWVLLISGIFAFSLYFYVLIFLYVTIFGSMKTKLVTGVLVFVAITYLIVGDSPFNELILDRMTYDSSDGFSGDNRTDYRFDAFYEQFWYTEMLWFGYGRDYCLLVADTGGASYKHLIVDFGIIMYLFFIIGFFLFYSSYKLSKKDNLLMLLIFVSIIFQRPFIFHMPYLFLLIAPAAYLASKKGDNVLCKQPFLDKDHR